MGHRPKILCFEDEPDILELMRLILVYNGFDFVGVTEGQVGLDRARAEKPDLILLNLEMPGVDGWEVHRQLKADDELADIPVIVRSATPQREAQQLGLDITRVNAYINEIDNVQAFLDLVYRVLGRA
jgi:CheY-like chemotaxis protein